MFEISALMLFFIIKETYIFFKNKIYNKWKPRIEHIAISRLILKVITKLCYRIHSTTEMWKQKKCSMFLVVVLSWFLEGFGDSYFFISHDSNVSPKLACVNLLVVWKKNFYTSTQNLCSLIYLKFKMLHKGWKMTSITVHYKEVLVQNDNIIGVRKR